MLCETLHTVITLYAVLVHVRLLATTSEKQEARVRWFPGDGVTPGFQHEVGS